MLPRNQRWIIIGLIVLVTLILSLFFLNKAQDTGNRPSDYSIASKAPFNQPDFFPIEQSVDLSLYQPNGQWLGRLILPTPDEIKTQFGGQDGSWIEIYNAPNPRLIGQKVKLSWQNNPEIKHYISLVTTDVDFTQQAQESIRKGNVQPVRLDGRSQVGPLQSLAGARPVDDVIVRLESVTVDAGQGQPQLKIAIPPILVTGRFYGLVVVLGPVAQGEIPPACPSVSPCSSEYFEVVHYNPKTQKFDGKKEIIRIPQQPASPSGRFYSTPYQLEASDAGQEGWYIYGGMDKNGIFTVQALKPRSLFNLEPKQMIVGSQPALTYIETDNWADTPRRKGKLASNLVDAQNPPGFKAWKTGDKGLFIHLFGGIGGQKAEPVTLGTVTGHFAYGLAKVIKEPLTNELQLDLQYEQIYAHNPAGIISGSHSWEDYMGNLQRGWAASRPVSDVIVKSNLLEDYNFNGTIFSPVDEILLQLKIMAARYRTGDGTGYAGVTPALSCVQDSNQAVYIALEVLKEKVRKSPEIIKWLQENPKNPQTLRFSRLVEFSKALKAKLVPENVVRPDWKFNAETLAGVTPRQGYSFIREDNLMNAFLSWRSMLPRTSHDEMSRLFLNHDSQLHFLRINQIGGRDRTITPLAPTYLLGDVPILSQIGRRLLMATFSPLNFQAWLISLLILGLYALIALPIGFATKFLRRSVSSLPLSTLVPRFLLAFLTPALLEEAIMRVAWLPHPQENVPSDLWNIWAVLGIIIFMLYHPLNCLLFYKRGYPLFLKPIFLILTGLLGVACTVAYWFTGSLWTITVIHWLVVVVWLFFLGGEEKLSQPHLSRVKPKRRMKRMKVRR